MLIPVSVLIVFGAVWVFLRMSSSGQFDDMEGPAYRILLDDDDTSAKTPPPKDAPSDR